MLGSVAAATAATPTILLESGGAAPGGTTFTEFGLPSLSANGVSYWAEVATGPYGIFSTSLTGTTAQIALQGQSAPGGGNYSSFPGATNPPLINTASQVGFSSTFDNGKGINALFVASGSPYTVTRSVAAGQAAPDGNGTFSSVPTGFSMNSTGQIGFVGTLTGTAHGSTDNLGVYRVDRGGGNLTQIARYGATVPGGNGTFGATNAFNAAFLGPLLNDSGLAVFLASITGSTHTSDEAVYTSNGTTLTQISRLGDLVTLRGTTGTITAISSIPAINASGATGFTAPYTVSATGSNFSLFRAPAGGGALTEIVYGGEALTFGGGTITGLGEGVTINASGQVATLIRTNTSEANVGGGGIIRGSGGGTYTLVARNNEASPRGDGSTLEYFGNSTFALNDSGNLAFTASLTNSGGTNVTGLFYYSDATGLTEILQMGDSFGGSTVSDISFAGNSAPGDQDPNGTGLNSANQVTFHFALANNKTGIAVWTAVFSNQAADTPVLPAWALVLLACMLLVLGSSLMPENPVTRAFQRN